MSSLASIDPRRLGEELQAARKQRGLTQLEAAEALGMARTTMIAIEKGERRLSSEEFLRACDLYGRSAAEFLRDQPRTGTFVAQFRAWQAEGALAAPTVAASEQLERLAQGYVRLEQLTGQALAYNYPPALNLRDLRFDLRQAAEDLAYHERNRLGLGDGPVLSLRERLEADVGLRVFVYPMDSRVAGVYGFADELGGCIGINSKHPFERGRWTLAHEFAHFLTTRLHPDADSLAQQRGRSEAERFADSFAACFLMPASGLNRRVSEQQKSGPLTIARVCALAAFYRVSVQAMMLRLEDLRRIRPGTWEGLRQRGFEARKTMKELALIAEDGPQAEARFSTRYAALAVSALQGHRLTEGQLAQEMGLDRMQTRRFLLRFDERLNAESDGSFRLLEDARMDLVLG